MFGCQSTIFLLWIAYSVAVSHRCSRCPRNVASDSNVSAPKSLISQSKQELLKKLGLKQRPPLDAFSQFRAPLKNYMDELKMVDEGDAVIETKEMFIFGQRDKSCESHSGSVCVTFNVSIDASQTILSASLRVNLKKERTVAPVLLQVTNADGSLVIGGEGKVRHHWVSIDANQLLRHWIDNRRSTVHQAQITCSNCDLGLDWLADDMPIFVQVNVATPGPSAESRRRRSSECGVGENKGCCLQSYYINFTTIGWDDWILEPPGYYVNYCVGVCNLGQASSVSAKLTEAQRAVEGGKSHSCCSPKAYGPLTLIYAPELFLYYKKTLKQMVVTDCGC